MAGTKRSASDAGTRETRASKNAKTGDAPSSAKGSKGAAKGGKKGAKASIAPSAFKSKALPLHVNFTHTPPVITDEKTVSTTSADPGSIGSATLVPTEFSTGSYGWKGTKRVTIEIPNPEGGEGEKVQVIISINATVVGSKNATEGAEESVEEPKEPFEEGKTEDAADVPEELAVE